MMTFDGVGDGLRQGDCEAKMVGTTRGREGGARRGNATTIRHNERTRGWRIERMARDDTASSWRNETTRGRLDETMRRREGGALRGDATTS